MAQGPTATTVSANPGLGNSAITIQGTVTDQSPGMTTLGIPAKGTPAISDASMTQWMEYLYMQYPEPTNATGVPVTLTYTDPNNNTYTMGTTTSDINGHYSYDFTPTIPGLYQVTATFCGSNSYYTSSAAAAFTYAPTATVAPTASPQANLATTTDLMTYIAVAVIAIIIAIAIVGLLLSKKHA